jgi:hypothetical protein
VAALPLAPQDQDEVAAELHPAVKVMPVGLFCCSPVIDPGLPSETASPSL